MHKPFQHTTPGFSDPDQKPRHKGGFVWLGERDYLAHQCARPAGSLRSLTIPSLGLLLKPPARGFSSLPGTKNPP